MNMQQEDDRTKIYTNEGTVTYKECRKNHAASIGKYAVDGCGEFMPAGAAGSSAVLRCAACSCHRNFHKKVVGGRTEHECRCGSYIPTTPQ